MRDDFVNQGQRFLKLNFKSFLVAIIFIVLKRQVTLVRFH